MPIPMGKAVDIPPPRRTEEPDFALAACQPPRQCYFSDQALVLVRRNSGIRGAGFQRAITRISSQSGGKTRSTKTDKPAIGPIDATYQTSDSQAYERFVAERKDERPEDRPDPIAAYQPFYYFDLFTVLLQCCVIRHG
jgi:hypothetical protein